MLSLNSSTSGSPPVTTATTAGVRYPIAATGASLLPVSSLWTSPSAGVLRNTYASRYRVSIHGVVSLQKVAGGTVVTDVYLQGSPDGVTWSDIGPPASLPSTNTAAQYTVVADGMIDTTTQYIRMALSTATNGTQYNTRTLYLRIGVAGS